MNTLSDIDVDLPDLTVASRKGKKRVRVPVRVGEEYQADLPVYTPGRVHEDYPEKAMLVWVPSIIDDPELDRYENTAVTKFGYSKEQALAMLCWHKYDLSGAYRDLTKFTPVPSEWSNYDKLLFEQTLKNVGKKFEAIQKNMPGKSVKSLVGYYFSTERPKSKSTAKKSASETTPKLMAQYKQKTPVGSLKKPLKRLSVAKSTPAQVKPSDLLKKNLKRQVETAITKKNSSKPDSSPYTISVTDGSDVSPVFTKVEAVTSKVVKKHITGTPARTKPTRKLGTGIQPSSLLEDSVMPSSNAEHKAVSSSTPLRAAVTGFEESINESHPLESVEATPIRAPSYVEPRSPEPMMVTGGLAKMCSIM